MEKRERTEISPDILAMMETESESGSKTSGDISDQGPSDAGIRELVELTEACEEKQALLESLEKQTKELNSEIIRLTDDLIPSKMQELGIQNFTLANGKKISVKEMVFASIAKDRQDAAFKWLTDNGFGDILKKELSFKLDNTATIDVMKAFVILQREFEGLVSGSMGMSVHPSTLKAMVKEQLDDDNVKFQSDEVKKLLGIYEVNRAVIK